MFCLFKIQPVKLSKVSCFKPSGTEQQLYFRTRFTMLICHIVRSGFNIHSLQNNQHELLSDKPVNLTTLALNAHVHINKKQK